LANADGIALYFSDFMELHTMLRSLICNVVNNVSFLQASIISIRGLFLPAQSFGFRYTAKIGVAVCAMLYLFTKSGR